jgi:hypothetical protein
MFKNIKINSFHILILCVFLLGVFLRVLGIDKPEGLWYDEINTYFIAKQSFPFGILHTLIERDLHFPLYYMLLHLWMNIFGESDIALRLLSVIFGVLTLPVAYFVGQELNGKKGGLLTLLLFGINSGLIFYSQEVRFYSALVFFCTLIALFLIRVDKNPSKLNYAGLIISNLLIIYTSTIGCVFVFIEMLIFMIYLIFIGKNLKSFFIANMILLILSIPIMPLLVIFYSVKSKLLFDYFDYYKFNIFLFSNIIDNIGGPLAPRYSFLTNKILSCLVSVSVFVFFLAIVKSITRRKIVLTLFLIGLIPFLLELILAIQGKFAFIYCHTIFSIPFFIIAASCGFFEFKKKFLAKALLVIYLAINLSYTCFYKQSVCYISRQDGFNTVARKLQSVNATNQDKLFLIPFGGYLGIKYDYKAKVVPLLLDFSFNNGESFKYIFDDNFINSLNKENVYYKLKPFMYSKNPTAIFTKFVQQDVLNKIPKDRYLYIAVVNYGALHYSKEHMIDGIREKVTDDILYIIKENKNMKLVSMQAVDGCAFFIFKRIK